MRPVESGRFIPVSRWHPHGIGRWLTSPRKACRALSHAPVAVRCIDPGTAPLGHADTVTRWWFDRSCGDDAVRIEFVSAAQLRHFAIRWRILADAIHRIGRDDPTFACREVRIDLGDGVGPEVGSDVFAFARLPGSAARLIPNPYLLRPRPWLGRPRPWGRKRDSLYFRGTSTGSGAYDANTRVALCRVARTIPRSDCRLSRLKQIDRMFAARLRQDGLIGWRQPPTALNRHRFCVEADGNSSSWDRYMLIGLLGGVPIRFETVWEECWHDLLVDGGNCVVADRDTLPDVVARLRRDDHAARAIAAQATALVADHLSHTALRRRLARALAGA